MSKSVRGDQTLQSMQRVGKGDSVEKMGGDRRPTEEKEKEGGEAGVGGPPGKNSTEGQRAVTQPSLSAWMSHGHGCVTAMANSGNDEALVWVERTLWLQE